MKRCPYCEVFIPDDAAECPSCRNVLPTEPASSARRSDRAIPRSAAPPEADEGIESIATLPEEFVESLIGESEEPSGRPPWVRLTRRSAKVVFRLVFPRTASAIFSFGFWTLRAIGLTILASWLYFGIENSTWDYTKLGAGLVTLIAGPLFLRLIEFILEQFLFHGQVGQNWSDFWTFRRMMTPRSIQGAFFVGFWLLVIAGFIRVAEGFVDLVCAEKVQRAQELLTIKEIEQISADTALPKNLIRQISYVVALNMRGGSEATTPTLSAAGLDDWRGLASSLIGAGHDHVHPLVKILRGILLMVVGPLILRFTCETIILFFRVNETLTDISKEIETARRQNEPEEDEPAE
ncbi:DUF4282 domain-containing protein [Candidatus Sumerlaeota bacterium]|nr:DUF4282 domain-containing protein [Candidatus Sumerlaeota bacterium]